MDDRFGEMLDTSPDARTRYFHLLARLTPAERARKVVSLGRAARALARAGIRQSHPDASPDAVEFELIARLYGPAVARRLASFVPATRG
jgi:hypothetical protein